MPIHLYAEQGNIAKVQQEITDGVDINSEYGYDSQTPLMFAVSSPHANNALSMIQMIINLNQYGALIDLGRQLHSYPMAK